mmetsp:Transcript_5380/g.15937  ORF Transcript_5380/g.15937 Transcript_5380/m.15937 type:complete len:337 (+) Transcript_5380:245-1255(+)
MAQRPVVEHLVGKLSRLTITAPMPYCLRDGEHHGYDDMEYCSNNDQCGLITSLLAKLEGEAQTYAMELLAADAGAIGSVFGYLRHHKTSDQERAFIFATFDTMTSGVLIQNLKTIADAFNYLWNCKCPVDRALIQDAWPLITAKTTPGSRLPPCVELARETIERMAQFDDADEFDVDVDGELIASHERNSLCDEDDNWKGACPLFGFLEPSEQALILTPFASYFVSKINRRINHDSREGPRRGDLEKWSRLFSHLPMTIQLQYRGSIEAIESKYFLQLSLIGVVGDYGYYPAARCAEKIKERWNRFIRLQDTLCRCPDHAVLGHIHVRPLIFGFLV